MSKLILKPKYASICGAILLAVGIGGCGGSSASSSASPKPTIVLTSPVVSNGQRLPRRYTCDGKNISLPLSWRGVPASAAELNVFVLALQEQNKLSPQWGVAHLLPTVKGLKAGKLPRGAILGTNESGGSNYSVCPPKGFRTTYLVFVYAVPQSFSLQPGFRALDLLGSVNHTASQYGQLTFTYTRR